MKKIVALVLSLAMVCSLLVGCARENDVVNINSDGSGTVTIGSYLSEKLFNRYKPGDVGSFDGMGSTVVKKTFSDGEYKGYEHTYKFISFQRLTTMMLGPEFGVTILLSDFIGSTDVVDGQLVGTLKFNVKSADLVARQGEAQSDGAVINVDDVKSGVYADFNITFPGTVTDVQADASTYKRSGNTVKFTFTPPDKTTTVSVSGVLCKADDSRVSSKVTPSRTYNNQFEDVPANAWYADALKTVYETGLIDGTSAKTFSPNAPLTYGQVMAMVTRLYSTYIGDNHKFVKTSADDAWCQPYFDYARSLNMIMNDGDQSYKEYCSRAEMCHVVICSLPSNEFVPLKKPTNFSDVSKDAMYEFVAADIAACNRAGIVNGNTATTFSPDANLTRAQAVAILARVIKPSMREKK